MTTIGEITHSQPGDMEIMGTVTTPPAPFWVQVLRWAAAVLAVAAVVAGGRYALDRIDAAADRVADATTEAFNAEVDNRNARIREQNRLRASMSDDCFGSQVNGAMQQNGCFLQYIAALTGS